MAVTEDIQSAIKANNVVIGYNESISYIKTNSPKAVIAANNLPVEKRNELEHNAKVSKSKFEMFEGTSRELGVACGKPFPVSIILIK